jgi:hypothetical protein
MFLASLILGSCLFRLTVAGGADDPFSDKAIKYDKSCDSSQQYVIGKAWDNAMSIVNHVANLNPSAADDVPFHELFGPTDRNYSAIIPVIFRNMNSNVWSVTAACDLVDSTPSISVSNYLCGAGIRIHFG